MVLDVRFECPSGVLGPPFDSLPLVVERWRADRDGDPRMRHSILLRPRCCKGTDSSVGIVGESTSVPQVYNDVTDEELRLFYSGARSTVSEVETAAGSDVLRRLHATLHGSFYSSLVPSLLAQPSVEYVSDTGLFVGFESQVGRPLHAYRLLRLHCSCRTRFLRVGARVDCAVPFTFNVVVFVGGSQRLGRLRVGRPRCCTSRAPWRRYPQLPRRVPSSPDVVL